MSRSFASQFDPDGAFAIDLIDLERASEEARETGERVERHSVLKYSIAPRSVGHQELAKALAQFHESSRHAATALSSSVADLADRMSQTARAYLEAEVAAADALGSGMGAGGAEP